MASLLSAVRTRFFNKSNKPLAGGKVYTYEANSTNPKVTWSDEALTVQNTNPVLLDNEGTALIFFSGKYRFRIEDRDGVLVEDNPSVTSLVGIDGVTSDIVKDGDESQKDINDKSLAMCETVAQLRTLKPRKDGAVMFVKSHSNNGSGGVNYIWNEDSLLPDDDGYIIKSETTDTGRWIADYGTSPITPRHFGAKGDGVNDERLQCEKSIVVAAKLKIKWLVQKDDIYLLNSYANYSEIAHFSAGLLPLFSE
ncbi:hypothetical protein OLN43_14675, partial [Acinetobacter baumannii]|nr:hypothetical protein [Acinetobacter baumannii]